jgi:hypothetical protein
LILELLTWLQAVGLAEDTSFKMPLKQQMLADALASACNILTVWFGIFARVEGAGTKIG